MRVARGRICDVERIQNGLTEGFPGKFEGLAFKRGIEKITLRS